MPGFALAHAAPCEEVLKSDVALITLETPVEFGSPNDPVSVVLMSGMYGQHIPSGIPVGIAETLLAEEKMEQISRAESAEEVLLIMSGETDVPA